MTTGPQSSPKFPIINTGVMAVGKKRAALRDRTASAEERNEPGKCWSRQTEMLGLVKAGWEEAPVSWCGCRGHVACRCVQSPGAACSTCSWDFLTPTRMAGIKGGGQEVWARKWRHESPHPLTHGWGWETEQLLWEIVWQLI